MSPAGPDPTPRRIRRVAGQRRAAGQSPASYAPPPAPSTSTFGSTAAPPAPPAVEAPPRPAPPREKPDRPGRFAGWRSRLRPSRPAAGSAPGGRKAVALGWSLIALFVVLATLVVLLLQGWLHSRAVSAARDDAVAAATVAVPQVASYDYRTFDADTTRAAKLLTASFRKDYLDVQQKTVRTPAVQYKASVTADLVAIGAISGSTSDVKMLVFLDQTTKNTKLAAPKLSQNRLHVEMRKVGGKWLIAHLDLF